MKSILISMNIYMALDYVDDTILWVLFVIEIFESILVNLDDFLRQRGDDF